uniref:SAM domain-containing protein n=1 Tax=Entomoneis paludosa TaxID=265537 RepID=A0A7S2V852_9STRA
MAPPEEENVSKWSVKDVTDWLDSISLGHKSDLIETAKFDGEKLSGASAEDLQAIGFSNLQCKKILRELESRPASGGAALQAENASLKQEMAELRAMVKSLQTQMGASKPAASTGVIAARPTTVIPFCTRAVIEGAQTQVLTVTLSPGEVLRAEPGAMVHMSYYIKMETKTGGGGGGFRRLMTGQSLFLTEFTYMGPKGSADTIALTPDFPAEIIPVNLDHYQRKIICQRGSLLASGLIDISIEFTQSFGAGFFGGEGFILQGLNGSGYVFLNARGTVLKKDLDAGEKLIVATGNLVAFSSTVKYGITNMGGGLQNDFFGGEGFFVSEMTGPGTVWVESHDMSRLWKEMQSKV